MNIIAKKLMGGSLSFLLAAVLALATSGAWAGWVWTGAGNGYWNSNNYNQKGETGGTGMFFRSGVDDTSGNEIVVVSNDVHFNGNEAFGYNFYVDRGTSLGVPATLAADTDAYGITVTKGLNVGTTGSSFGDGYLWIKNGTYSFNGVNLGENADNPASSGYLTIGSSNRATAFTSEGNLVIHNGEVAVERAMVTVNGNFKMNDKSGSTAMFYNRGGNLVVTNDLYVQYRGSGEFYMEGGYVTVSNIVRFGEYYLNSGDKANIYLNGGVFEAKTFRFHNGEYGYVVFNGGTYKAMSDGSIASTEGRLGAVSRLHFKVGERGGTIDTAGYDVVFPLRLLQDGSSTGGLYVKGGGSLTLKSANVTYTGKTCVEAGTTLVVEEATAKSNILANGLELVGAPTVGTHYTVFVCDDMLSDADLANVTCGVASDFAAAIGTDGKSIVVTVTALKSGYWTGAKDNNLSDATNWSDNVVPTSGNPTIYCPVATTLTVGDTFAPTTITIPDESSVVTIGEGDLHLSGSLTNAMKLAVGSGASLIVDGDLVLCKSSGTALYSNEGTVMVKGDVDFKLVDDAHTTYYQYEVVTDATMPIMARGLAYNGAGSKYLTVYLGKNIDSTRAGQWVIGSNGLHYKSKRNIWHTGFMMGQGVTTLYSSSDWSLASSDGSGSTRDLGNYYNAGSTVIENSSLVFDTNNYTNNAVAHTITLNGRLISSATTDPAVTIKGAGTVVVNTSEGIGRDGYQKTSIGTTLAVTDTATLKINAGKSIVGNGKVSLAAGTTLALDSSALGAIGDVEFVPCIPGLALPTTGAATIRINGRRLRSGDHVVASVAPGTAANVAPDLSSAALDGRRASFRVDNGVLVLNIQSNGTKIVVR